MILKIIVEVQGADLRRFDKHKKRAATLWTLKIFVEAQGADLRRFDKHKKRATLGTGEYPSVMNCTLFAVHKALKYEWVIIPCHLMLYTNKELQNSCTGSWDLIASSKCVDNEHVQ